MTGKREFRRITQLKVEIDFGGGGRPVGRLAWRDRVVYFEYDPGFLSSRLEISPFRLKLFPGLVEGPTGVFERLPGVFNDSLPDGWGRLLMDRKLRDVGIQPGQLTPLDRLAWVGSHGMGALVYKPEHHALAAADGGAIDLDRLAEESQRVLDDSPKAVLDELLRVGGPPHGARPKALVGLSSDHAGLIHGVDALPEAHEHWIVKFRAVGDPLDIGAIEHAYAEMAKTAEVDMPPTILFPATKGPGYFGIKRFDLLGNRRVHMHTASGLLNVDHTLPSMGYATLLKLTRSLTRDQAAVEQMFTRMAFNVFAHNRDDHTKNHSFLMSETGVWSVSPAYDVTFSAGPGGEHALDIGGEGRRPGMANILDVADEVGVPRGRAEEIVDRVRAAVDRWPEFAAFTGVSNAMTTEIDKQLNGARKLARTPRPAPAPEAVLKTAAKPSVGRQPK